MKKQIVLFSALFMFVGSRISAQSTSNNNNFLPAGKFLGFNATNGTNPLNIRTNNLNRIIVSQVQIGSPLILGGTANSAVPGFGLMRIGINYDANNPITFPQAILHMGPRSSSFSKA